MTEPKIHLDEVRMSNIELGDAVRGVKLLDWVDPESLRHIAEEYLRHHDDDGIAEWDDVLLEAFTEGFLLGVRFQDAGGRQKDDRKRR